MGDRKRTQLTAPFQGYDHPGGNFTTRGSVRCCGLHPWLTKHALSGQIHDCVKVRWAAALRSDIFTQKAAEPNNSKGWIFDLAKQSWIVIFLANQQLYLQMKTPLILIFVLSLSATSFAQSGWQPFSGPCGNDFDFVSDSAGVVLSGQNVYFTVDGGATWTNSNLPPGTPKSIHLSSPGNATVFGYQYQSAYLNNCWRVSSSDTGHSWSGGNAGGQGMGYEIIDRYSGHYYYGTAPIGYEVYGCNTVWDDATGRSYHISPASYSPIGIQHIAFSDNVGFASMSDNTLFRTLDSGASWSQVKSQTIDSFYTGSEYGGGYIISPSPDGSWFILHGTSVYKSVDTGLTWSVFMSFPYGVMLMEINAHGIGYLTVGDEDYVMATTDSGKTWYTQGIGYPGPSGVYLFNDSVAVIVGCKSVKTFDGGGGRKPVLSMPRMIYFGQADLNVGVHQTVVLRNVSDSIVRIDSLLPGTLHLTMTPASGIIYPHDSLSVDLELTVLNGGDLQADAELATNTARKLELFTVFASGKASVFVADPDTLHFGITEIGETQYKHFKLSNISQTGDLLKAAYTDNSSFQVYGGVGDSLGTLSLRVGYTPVAARVDTGKLFLVSGEGNIDTVWMEGTGTTSREGGRTLAWVRTERDVRDTLHHTAGALLTMGDSIIVIGSHQGISFSYQPIAYDFSESGQLLSKVELPTSAPTYDGVEFTVSDKYHGCFVLSHSDNQDWLHYIDSLGRVSLINSLGYINNAYTSMLLRPDQSVFVLTNISGHGPNEIGMSAFNSQGEILMKEDIWGPSLYKRRWDPPYSGIDMATSSVQAHDGSIYISLYRDQSVDGWGAQYYGYLFSVSGTNVQSIFEDHRYYDVVAIALDSDQNIYEAIRSGDTLLAQKIDVSGHLVWSRVLQTGVQGLSDPVFMAADQHGGVFISYAHNTLYEDKDVATLRFSASTGVMSWITEFDGLGGAADVIKKMSLDQNGNVCALIQSADTVKSDIVFLKYAPDGHELYRLRYAGPNGGQALPSDFTLTDKGEIFICGGSQDVIGYTDIALIKYQEPKNSVSQRQVQPMSVSLSPNPWHTAAFLSFENPGQEPVQISIVDILGRTFRTYSTDRSSIRIDREGLPNGMYTLIIRDGRKETALMTILD